MLAYGASLGPAGHVWVHECERVYFMAGCGIARVFLTFFLMRSHLPNSLMSRSSSTSGAMFPRYIFVVWGSPSSNDPPLRNPPTAPGRSSLKVRAGGGRCRGRGDVVLNRGHSSLEGICCTHVAPRDVIHGDLAIPQHLQPLIPGLLLPTFK